MKKKTFLFAISAFVLIVSVSGFSSQKSYDPVLYWFDEFGNYTGYMNTYNDELAVTPCRNTSTVVCERGYEQSDLVNPQNPYLGINTSAQVDGEIFKD